MHRLEVSDMSESPKRTVLEVSDMSESPKRVVLEVSDMSESPGHGVMGVWRRFGTIPDEKNRIK
jgi:hypothetical protein